MDNLIKARLRMVRDQIAGRGISNAALLEAMSKVQREFFVPPHLAEFAYLDTPLPIESGQTISQPYIVALIIEVVAPRPTDRALELGTGSGYGAAVLSQLVAEVYTVERDERLVEQATKRLADLGYTNVKVLHGDGTLGWPEHAPYDVIVVTAGGPQIPKPLLEQLAIGGRLVIPIRERLQSLMRVTRVGKDQYDEENLSPVQFVPLIGAQGWEPGVSLPERPAPSETIAKLIRENAEPIGDIDEVDLGPLDRIADARVVLLGEATHARPHPIKLKKIVPSHEASYERLCHDSRVEAFMLHLRDPRRPEVRVELMPVRLERAIGVIYRPKSELMSHYFQACLPRQFDEYVWFDETRTVTPCRRSPLPEFRRPIRSACRRRRTDVARFCRCEGCKSNSNKWT